MSETDDAQNWDEGLNRRERLFVLYFCTGDEITFLQPTASYRKAYTKTDKKGRTIVPEDNNCWTSSSRLMKKQTVRTAISRLLEKTQAEIDEQSQYRLLRELNELAFFNPAELIKADGSLVKKKLADLGDKARCIAQIQPTKYGPRVTLVDRSGYIDKLLKYFELVRPEQQIDISMPVIALPGKPESDEAWNQKWE